MDTQLSRYESRLRAIRPDLRIESVKLNTEGLVNDVVIVNDEWVFRFAKDEASSRALAIELDILSRLRPHLELAVPAPFHVERDVMAYRLLPGVPLTRRRLLAQTDAQQHALAQQMGTFLRQLHGVSPEGLPPTLAPITRERWLDLQARIEHKVYPLLLPFQVEWARDLFEQALGDDKFFAFEPRLIHGDLAAYHLLFDQGRLSGVIDFGVGGAGDPATDIAALLTNYGETFVRRLAEAYPALEEHLPRARFYAQAIELQWVLLGLESGESFWFTAHLGGARDLS